MMFSFKQLATLGIVAAGALNSHLTDAATFPCINLESVIPQTEIPFVGYRDLCGDTDHLPYDGSTSASGMMIDARNSEDLWYDTARYKRYGTYQPPSQVDWVVPEGFSNLWTQVYYAEDNAERFGHMRYFASLDGTTWDEVTDVQRTDPVSTNSSPSYRGYWFMKQEQAVFDKSYKHFRALFPAPCQGEVDNPNVKSCITLGVPDDQKDIYFAPQLGEVLLGRDSSTLSVPSNVNLEAGSTSMKVTWQAPPKAANMDIIGYSLYYMEAPPRTTSPDFDPLHSYDFSMVNLPNVNSVIMADLKPGTIYVVRVQAINANGAGELSGTVWTSTLAQGAVSAVDTESGTCSRQDIPTTLPTVRGGGSGSGDNGSGDKGPGDSSYSDGSRMHETSSFNLLRPVLGVIASVTAVGAAVMAGF